MRYHSNAREAVRIVVKATVIEADDMEWNARAQQILEKIRKYRNDEDGWKIAKKSVSLSSFTLDRI